MEIIATICSKSKRDDNGLLPAMARYTGAHIEESFRVARDRGLAFFILSGKYGLISSTSEIPYYDKYLEMKDTRELAKTVKDQILDSKISTVHFFIEEDPRWVPYIETIKEACDLARAQLSIERLS